MAWSFETLKVGVARFEGFDFDVRLVRERTAPNTYFAIYAMNAQGQFGSVEEALAYCERTFTEVFWRTSLDVGHDDTSCPTCQAPIERSPRYPRALCPPCVLEAVDRDGRSLRFYNASVGGAFDARRADGESTKDHACWVREVACRADEAYFGGIVVQPLEDKPD